MLRDFIDLHDQIVFSGSFIHSLAGGNLGGFHFVASWVDSTLRAVVNMQMRCTCPFNIPISFALAMYQGIWLQAHVMCRRSLHSVFHGVYSNLLSHQYCARLISITFSLVFIAHFLSKLLLIFPLDRALLWCSTWRALLILEFLMDPKTLVVWELK